MVVTRENKFGRTTQSTIVYLLVTAHIAHCIVVSFAILTPAISYCEGAGEWINLVYNL